jgi:hypothetical protein
MNILTHKLSCNNRDTLTKLLDLKAFRYDLIENQWC